MLLEVVVVIKVVNVTKVVKIAINLTVKIPGH